MARFVIKVGTNLLTLPDGGLNTEQIKSFVDQIVKLHKKNHEIILVTSGAVASGRGELHLKKEKKTIPARQALAAIGQAILMNVYRENFSKKEVKIAQILLTDLDFKIKSNFLNTRGIMNLLLSHKVIPIINENDVTAYAEIKFGDNDKLAAKTAAMISADLLIILTDVEGLYDSNPDKNPKAKLISEVKKINQKIIDFAEGPTAKNSLGGMISKVKAALYAGEAGVPTIVASGKIENILLDLILRNKAQGTYFSARTNSKKQPKKWLKAAECPPSAKVIVDSGAKIALIKKGGSLLPMGITEVKGEFERGDVVMIFDSKNKKIGFGQSNYSAAELRIIKKLHSDEIEKTLGYSFEPEVIHRDNMTILA